MSESSRGRDPTLPFASDAAVVADADRCSGEICNEGSGDEDLWGSDDASNEGSGLDVTQKCLPTVEPEGDANGGDVDGSGGDIGGGGGGDIDSVGSWCEGNNNGGGGGESGSWCESGGDNGSWGEASGDDASWCDEGGVGGISYE